MAYCMEEQLSGMLSLTDRPLGYDRWWISLKSFGTFLGTMPTGYVRNTGNSAVWKDPAILPSSCSLDSLEYRISGFCSALFKYGDSNKVWSLLENRWLNITFGFGRSPQGAVQTVPFLRFLRVTRELPRSLNCLLYVRKTSALWSKYTIYKKRPEKYISSLISLK